MRRNTRKTTDEFVADAKLVHGDKYDYSNVDYINSHIKTNVICSSHGGFQISPTNHLKGRGCPKCKFDKLASNFLSTTEEFVKKATHKHREKYGSGMVKYSGAFVHVPIICPLHGVFNQTPDNHTHGCGCPKCKTSRGELAIVEYFQNNNIHYEHQKMFSDCRNPLTTKLLKFDFFVPTKNLLIEFDGEQHFRTGKFGKHPTNTEDVERNKYRDELKNIYAINKGIELLRISYEDIDIIPEILDSALL